MAAKRKTTTKKDLENKITELEGKLSKLTTELVKPAPKPAETKPAEKPAATTKPKGVLPKGMDKPAAAKPAETKPAEKPAATTKPKGVLPKGMDKPAAAKPAETKPAEKPAATTKPKGVLPKGTSKPAETKPAKTNAQPPANVQEALENAYYSAPQTDLHQYRAKVTGYTPAPNRYFVRKTAPVGKVPTSNWNEQKTKVTGYTQPSNQYFATRARLAYHPPNKTFGSFSGVNMSVDGIAQTEQVTISKPAKRGTLPKGF